MTLTRATFVALLGVMVLSPDALLIRLTGEEEFTVLFWRGVMQAGVILSVLVVLRRERLWADMRAAGWHGIAYAVLFGFTASGFVYAASHTTVANTLFIVATSPVWAAVMGWVFLREGIGRRMAVTIAVVLTGMALIAAGSVGGAGTWHGNLAALLCAVGLAAALTVARGARASMVPMTGVGGFVIAAVGLAMGGAHLPSAEGLAPLLIMGLIVVPISFTLITMAARHLPPARSSLIMLLEAPFGLAIVWIALGETPGPLALGGGALVLIALTVNNVLTLREERAPSQAR